MIARLRNTAVHGDSTKVGLRTLKGRPRFNRTVDKFFGGLTIAINDTAAYKVEVLDYEKLENTFNASLRVTLYDHFGLDKPDLEKVYVNLAGFRAWFILQHLRAYKPFVTIIANNYEITGDL